MADAGYADGFAVKMPSLFFTKPFEPTIGQALKDIGINVTWEPVPPQNSNLALTSGQYPMFFIAEGLGMNARDADSFFAPTGLRNPFHSTSPEVTGLLRQAAGEQDPAKATEAFKKLNTYGVQNAWNSPIFFVGTSWVTKKGITYLGDGSSTLSTVRAFGTTG
jgi:peptide/nickel transport system substrate-binding protein